MYEVECRLMDRRSGDYRWFLIRALPMRDEAGQVARWVGTCTDIDDSKRGEVELRASESRFRRLFASGLIGIAFSDKQGAFLDGNDEFLRIVGYTREDLRAGKVRWRDMTPARYAELDVRGMAEAAERGFCTPYEKEYVRKDGTLAPVLIGYALLEGTDDHYIAFVLDATARKRAEEALREANRRKDVFLAMLAHELRNPLAPILTGAELLRKIAPPDAQLQKVRDMMERQVRHLVRMVDDLLEVSRITRGKIQLQRERVDLRDVAQNAVDSSGPLLGARRHELTIHVPAAPVEVEGDAVRLAQVTTNLLTNAAKFTPEGGHIWLTVERDGRSGVVRVRDNGSGIPPEMLPRVFDMFTQVKEMVKQAQGGLGIGLALAKGLVELHGGTVEGTSAGPGHGAEFAVRIPLAGAQKAAEQQPVGLATGCSPCRILVVDDNVDAAESVSMLLSVMGHEVRTAPDGLSGIEQARTFQPDLILLDLGMPGMDGYETAKRLRDLPQLKTAKLVALSGWGADEDRRRTREAGFDARLVKPVTAAALERLMAELQVPSR